jgi:ferrous iron transport protein B
MSVSTTTASITIALVGNPNSGKTTLFNALTGLRQKVGNYPGVTVERKEGTFFNQHGHATRVIDLPGAYSLTSRSPDEAVLRDVLLGRRPDTPQPDRVVYVCDANHLERHFYLLSQILELGLPTIVVLNMIDLAEASGLRFDLPLLTQRLGCPVIATSATTGQGLQDLKIALSQAELPAPQPLANALPSAVRTALAHTRDSLCVSGILKSSSALLEPLYLIGHHDPTHVGLRPQDIGPVMQLRRRLDSECPGWEDHIITARFTAVDELCRSVVRRLDASSESTTDKIDRVLLHPVWGWAALILVLGCMFFLIFSLAEIPIGMIENATANFSGWLREKMPAGDVRDLLIDGVIAGVGSVVVFLPQILILFFFIGLMEDTGYMARVAFIMDRLMSRVGLNGRSFLPLLSSHACAVPGIMATRTIDSPKDRLLTILVAPLTSCSARLPVYSLLIATMLPSDLVSTLVKAASLTGLYALGIIGAFICAWFFNRTILRGQSAPMILELPAYHWPSWKSVFWQLFERAKVFLIRAGTVILALSIFIWAAATYPKHPDPDAPDHEKLAHSTAGRIGHFIEPAIRPLGYDWKIGIGLFGSFAARELFVSTMGTIYAVQAEDDDLTPLRRRLREETHPSTGLPVYTLATCLSLLIFYVFAMQCLSTIAVVRRETNSWRWPLFQLAYMSALAYIGAWLAYQLGSRFLT